MTEQMAAVVSPFCDEADALIDWHGGGYGDAINYVLCKLGADEVEEDSLLNKINHMGKMRRRGTLPSASAGGRAFRRGGCARAAVIPGRWLIWTQAYGKKRAGRFLFTHARAMEMA